MDSFSGLHCGELPIAALPVGHFSQVVISFGRSLEHGLRREETSRRSDSPRTKEAPEKTGRLPSIEAPG
jgi:hypothetical protein